MIIPNRLHGPRRVIIATFMDIEGERHYICDPAIDIEASDLQKYEESLYENLNFIKIKPGETPTYFTIIPLSRNLRYQLEIMSSVGERADWLWRCCIIKIENMQRFDICGNMIPVEVPVHDKQALSSDWLNDLNPNDSDLFGLTKMINRISEPQRPFSSASARPCGASG